MDVYFDSKIIDPDNKKKEEDIKFANFRKIITTSLERKFPQVSDKEDIKELASFISSSEEENLMNFVISNKEFIGKNKVMWLLASSNIDVIVKIHKYTWTNHCSFPAKKFFSVDSMFFKVRCSRRVQNNYLCSTSLLTASERL